MTYTRDDFITGLRALAQWLEGHPEVPTPGGLLRHTVLADTDAAGLARLAEISEAARTEIGGTFMQPDVVVVFGPIAYQAGYIRQERMAAYQQHMSTYSPPEVPGE